MSGWDNPAAATGSSGWEPTAEAPDWEAPTQTFDRADDGFDSGTNDGSDHNGFEAYTDLNSKHARTDGGGLTGECFNCGEIGHNKAECQNPRVERPFTGACRVCEQEGHRAADCPQKPALTCKACGTEGHVAAACTGLRILYDDSVPVLPSEEAFTKLQEVDNDGGAAAFRDALRAYTRANPHMDFVAVEDKLRSEDFQTYLIAKKDDLAGMHTLVDLQGKIDCAFVVTFQRSAKPKRQAFAAGWPQSPEENKERLKNAGLPLDRMVPCCLRCKQTGHISRECPEARPEPDTELCSRCSQPGHLLRHCTEPKKERGDQLCRNCQEPGHKALECPTKEPDTCRRCGGEGHRSYDCTMEQAPRLCRNCEKEGHLARECDQPPNPANMTCRNCEKKGHMSRECDQPKDYSKVQCRNCNQFGHGAARCPQPAQGGTGEDSGGAAADLAGTATADWDASATVAGAESWVSVPSTEVAAGGW